VDFRLLQLQVPAAAVQADKAPVAVQGAELAEVAAQLGTAQELRVKVTAAVVQYTFAVAEVAEPMV
jgi:hypothetical protein